MSEKRKDHKGRILRTGEYWDPKGKRYMFRKMVEGERITITDNDLIELRKKENELLHQIDRGRRISSKSVKMTLNEYFDNWLELYAKSGRKATTCTNYNSYYNTYIRETIGKKPITKVSKADIQKIVNDMVKDGRKHSTLSNLKSCLNIIFDCAVDDDVLVKNPVKNIQLPHTESEKREPVPEEHIKIFLEYVRNSDRYSYSYPAFLVLFNTGIRFGELAALTWEDVDIKAGEIHINKSLNRYRKKDYGFTMAVGSPKSKTSVRTIIMNDVVRLALMRLKMQSGKESPILPRVDDSGNVKGQVKGFIFLNSLGHVWSEPLFREHIGRIIRQYNKEARKMGKEQMEVWTPHQSRHSYTSLAYSVGADMKAVSHMLGHKSINTTLDVYADLSEEKKKEQEAVIKAVRIS